MTKTQEKLSQTLIKVWIQHWNSCFCLRHPTTLALGLFYLEAKWMLWGSGDFIGWEVWFQKEGKIKLSHSLDWWFHGIDVKVCWSQQWWLWAVHSYIVLWYPVGYFTLKCGTNSSISVEVLLSNFLTSCVIQGKHKTVRCINCTVCFLLNPSAQAAHNNITPG